MCWQSCETLAHNDECADDGSASCRVGCQCPHGMVMHEGHCVDPDETCPCIYNGNFYTVSKNTHDHICYLYEPLCDTSIHFLYIVILRDDIKSSGKFAILVI